MPPKTTKKKRKRKKASPNGRTPAAPPYINPNLAALVRPIEGLVEDPRNARLHPQRNLDDIRRSLAAFHQQTPIVALRDGTVLKGNGTLRVALALGWKMIACIEFDGTAEDATAYGIADNRTGESSEWDDAKLADLLTNIDGEIRINTGFDETEIGELLHGLGRLGTPAGDGKTEPDDVPDPPDDPTAKPGDGWVMGDHRIICGDALLVDPFAKGEAPARMCFTDPPYNVAYQANESIESLKARNRRTDGLVVPNDSMTAKEWWIFCTATAAMIGRLCSGSIYCCHGRGPEGRRLAQAFDEAHHWSGTIIWAKDQFVFGRSVYQHRYEPIWFGWKKNPDRYFVDDRTLADVWEFARPRSSPLHPTMKPVALVEQAILHSSQPRDLVFDPFAGSGTTIIACERLGRRCRAVELEPRFTDCCVRRWEEYTGRTAERIAPGQQ